MIATIPLMPAQRGCASKVSRSPDRTSPSPGLASSWLSSVTAIRLPAPNGQCPSTTGRLARPPAQGNPGKQGWELEQLEVVARRLSQGAAEHRGVEGDEHSGAASSNDFGGQLLLAGAGRAPSTFDQPCLERCRGILPDAMRLELVSRESPGAARCPLRAYTPSINPFVDSLRRHAIPRSDLRRGQPLGLIARSIADMPPPDPGKTKRPQADVNTEPLNLCRSIEMARQKRSEDLRSIVVLVGILERLTKIVAREKPRCIKYLDGLDDLLVVVAVEIQAPPRTLKNLRSKDPQPRCAPLAPARNGHTPENGPIGWRKKAHRPTIHHRHNNRKS